MSVEKKYAFRHQVKVQKLIVRGSLLPDRWVQSPTPPTKAAVYRRQRDCNESPYLYRIAPENPEMPFVEVILCVLYGLTLSPNRASKLIADHDSICPR